MRNEPENCRPPSHNAKTESGSPWNSLQLVITNSALDPMMPNTITCQASRESRSGSRSRSRAYRRNSHTPNRMPSATKTPNVRIVKGPTENEGNVRYGIAANMMPPCYGPTGMFPTVGSLPRLYPGGYPSIERHSRPKERP